MTINYEISAPVFNIQSYCLHDGPGIRSTVFVKGCPLRCVWCANPESQNAYPELMVYENLCKGCGKCPEKCPHKAITMQQKDGAWKAVTDREKCVNCGKCVPACLYDARTLSGTATTVREALDKVKKDKMFYEGSGGGMTISGGEALAHPEFALNLFAAAHEEGIHTAIETTSYASRETIDRVFSHVDVALLDLKQMDDEKHRKYIGVSNQKILENISYIYRELKKEVWLRLPVIPGYNDDKENIHRAGAFAAGLGKDIRICLLPYHRLGESKLESLGRASLLGIEPPPEAHMNELKEIMESYGLRTQIGG
ncbi:MAG: glycyl-radical enzyme activating protein [Lachnospiraceae bacterium]|nr:glycyl-radical enzyme activating protein [Lachnospiraceae bacterium]